MVTRARAVIVFVLGLAVGAAVVVGARLTFAEPPPGEALRVTQGFCKRALSEVADTWGMTVLPQDRANGERDRITVCTASSETGDVRLTVTVVALGGDSTRAPAERTRTALNAACTAIGAEAPGGDCAGPVMSADVAVGSASSFITPDERALVTVVLTVPPDRAAGTAAEVDGLARALRVGALFG